MNENERVVIEEIVSGVGSMEWADRQQKGDMRNSSHHLPMPGKT